MNQKFKTIAPSKNAFQNMRLNYSVAELDSSFAINSVSDSDSDPDFSSVFMNLDIYIFFFSVFALF